ncbi:hypothetical protein Baya_5758 [Bagarius yarrelli]|uniref:Uncharacterized protein n=1 Tax=Bagarius yarrelli TaxID=175774 RepID=A0A556TYE9_BAGYA|nr:hypothetical protein Baya_5758 [Bagarius yarrelli]
MKLDHDVKQDMKHLLTNQITGQDKPVPRSRAVGKVWTVKSLRSRNPVHSGALCCDEAATAVQLLRNKAAFLCGTQCGLVSDTLYLCLSQKRCSPTSLKRRCVRIQSHKDALCGTKTLQRLWV